MTYKKPLPLIRRRKHEPCPVCGEISYSLTGVHPQCAVRQADLKRLERINRDKKSKRVLKPVSDVKAWQKRCPKCRVVQHVRKKACECGYVFSDRARPPSSAGDAT